MEYFFDTCFITKINKNLKLTFILLLYYNKQLNKNYILSFIKKKL